ncbi:hypothetical protein L873DRAFT_1675192 [Choiromyces venosus 120613-1]|uniref:XPG N-terminal domain-containing protein n=1 Tax=Choiromyces venosus 120613-1 TaxID=1336337 RepID=A0A3N4JWW0_9PEZI|nr:hypothetical protein L873DRAFT_1675192 [Choiromyces venosus 120613-1]
MGVTGLWTIANPCARPVKLESLARKRLAVDASIWIYQFLKAVRDKEGHALQSSHVVGFFRRICKLLFFGIKPVFVFDGGAPPLKRQTIAGRKARREGRKEDARRTAGRILALQVQRSADIEAERRRKRKSGDWEDGPRTTRESCRRVIWKSMPACSAAGRKSTFTTFPKSTLTRISLSRCLWRIGTTFSMPRGYVPG